MNIVRKVYVSKRRLKYARDARGVSLADVAKGTGIPLETLRYCVKRELIMPDVLDKVSEFLDVAQEYLQEFKIEQWKKYDPETQTKIIEYQKIKDPGRKIAYDPDGYYIKNYFQHVEWEKAKKHSALLVPLIEDMAADILSDDELYFFIMGNYDRIYKSLESSIKRKAEKYIEEKSSGKVS